MGAPIEFLDDEPGEAAGAAVQPARAAGRHRSAARARPSRRAVTVLVALGAVLLAGLVTAGTLRSRPHHPATPTVRAAATVLSAVMDDPTGYALLASCAGSSELPDAGAWHSVHIVMQPTSGAQVERVPVGTAPPTCSGRVQSCSPGCRTERALPVTALAAVTSFDRGARLATTYSVLDRSGRLVYRLMVLRLTGGGVLRVDVLRHDVDHATAVAGVALSRAVGRQGSLDVVVTWALRSDLIEGSPGGWFVYAPPVSMLSRDARLTAR